MEDELGRKCVRELTKELPERVYPVGRLDKDSEGLVLMTNDGEFANRMMHPRYHVPKVYRVTLRPDFNEEHAVALLEGLELEGGAAPAGGDPGFGKRTRTDGGGDDPS